MVAKKPRIVIVGAGMAGLAAANRLHACSGSEDLFEVCVVEGGSRIGGRINTSEFCGDRIEMGATWIHGIEGSPIHKIAEETRSLESAQPWECMDGSPDELTTVAEGGYLVDRNVVEPISSLFNHLMGYAQGKCESEGGLCAAGACCDGLSIGSFLRQGLQLYWGCRKEEEAPVKGYGEWSRESLEEAIFALHESTQRTYTGAGDLFTLDFKAESEYRMFPGEEITIAKGYSSVIEALASTLPVGLIQLGRKVTKIKWRPQENPGFAGRPVKLHFSDGSSLSADHVIVTVSLGVLKAGTREGSGTLFDPPLPAFKTEAIARLGFGVVNKLFLQLGANQGESNNGFPFLQMAFHRPDFERRRHNIPWWIRKTASLYPIYKNSSVLLSWFAGKEALHLESLTDDEIIHGVSTTVSTFLPRGPNSNSCNGNASSNREEDKVPFVRVLRSRWGNDPLFLGSYCYVTVGASGDDLDTMAEPLPGAGGGSTPLQILFAGEATHRTHYSTTHGAFFSGIREASRLLQHYGCVGV